MNVKKSVIYQLALLTITAMPLVALIIDRFSEKVDLRISLWGVAPWWQQLVFGVLAGVVVAWLAQRIIAAAFMKEVTARYSRMLGRFELTISEVVFISVCAGVGEEILFRGALQPIFGIGITSLFFVAIHGYLNPKDWRLSVYGIYMVLAIAGIGWMAESLGLVAAILAHTIIDIYLLQKMQQSAQEVMIIEKHSGDTHEWEDPTNQE